METQFLLPQKSRMKLLEGQNAPFSYPFWGEGVLVLRLFCQRFRVIKQDTGEFKKLFILTIQNTKAIPPSWDVKKSLAVVSLWHQTVGSCSWRHNGHSECTHPWVFLEQADWGILQTDERVEKKRQQSTQYGEKWHRHTQDWWKFLGQLYVVFCPLAQNAIADEFKK